MNILRSYYCYGWRNVWVMEANLTCAANLPWQERVKRSIQSFENERDETRLHQQAIGEYSRLLEPILPPPPLAWDLAFWGV